MTVKHHYDDVEVEQVSVTLWKNKLTGYESHCEDQVRRQGSRYRDCPHEGCEGIIAFFESECLECREKTKIDLYKKAEREDYEGDSLLYSDWLKQFFTLDELYDYMYEEEKEWAIAELETLRLYLSLPVYPGEIDMNDHLEDYLADDIYADDVLSKECLSLVEKLNEAIIKNPPVSWEPSSVAVNLESILFTDKRKRNNEGENV